MKTPTLKRISALLLAICLLLVCSPGAYAESESLPRWKEAYLELLKETKRIKEGEYPSYDEPNMPLYAYSLYDIDKDGIPELFLHYGDSESSEYGEIYSFQDGVITLIDVARQGNPERSFFAYGYNYFSTYPEGNGVLFRHARAFVSMFYLWTMNGGSIKESELLLETDAPESPVGEFFHGSFDLTEFPAYTLEPLIRYEEWSQQLNDGAGSSTTTGIREPEFPRDDPLFFEKVVSGKTPVTSRFIPRRYNEWRLFYYQELRPENDVSTYPEAELNFAMTVSDVYTVRRDSYQLLDRAFFYADLNGDGQWEAVCNARYKVNDKAEVAVTFFLSEQDGKVYAYGQLDDPVKDVNRNGVVYYCYPDKYNETYIYEGAYRLYFDRKECFRVYVPMEHYAATEQENPETSNGSLPNTAAIGDTMRFGRYEQDNDLSDGKEEIEWRILVREKDRVLVASEYALDCRPFHGSYSEITWAECDLRKWLNEDFLNTAFNDEEQKLIFATTVNPDKNPKYKGTDNGASTQDRIFLLSLQEIERYFDSDEARRCEATAYAANQGSKINAEYGTCWWWTRSCGCDNYYVTEIRPNGDCNYVGSEGNRNYVSVRPAMWVDLTA